MVRTPGRCVAIERLQHDCLRVGHEHEAIANAVLAAEVAPIRLFSDGDACLARQRLLGNTAQARGSSQRDHLRVCNLYECVARNV